MPYQAPVLNLLCNIWSSPYPFPNNPPGGAPVHPNVPCAARMPRTQEGVEFAEGKALALELVLALGPNPDGSYVGTHDFDQPYTGAQYADATVFELPANSGQFYGCFQSRIVGAGWPNEHKLCYCVRLWKTGLNKAH